MTEPSPFESWPPDPSPSSFGPRIIDDLAGVVGVDHVLTSPEVTDGYLTDWTGRFRADPTIVVRPATLVEAATVIGICSDHGVTVCPQGGNTGLVGGSVPLDGGIVVSTRRLTRLDPVDVASGRVTVGAGVTLGDLQRHARIAGMTYGVDLGARDSATVGGTVATNAGGNNVIRHGMTRDNLVGIEVVLADGSVMSDLRGLEKDNTGYDLPGLFCGSEGTLGLITAATVRLHPLYPQRVTGLLAFGSVGAATAAVGSLVAAQLPLEAVELMLGTGFELVRDSFGLPSVFKGAHAAYLLVECADATPVTERLGSVAGGLDGLEDVAVADDAARRSSLWRYRELHTEAVAGIGPTLKLDVSVPLGVVGRFVEETIDSVASMYPAARIWIWGHAGDGNVHVNVTGLPETSEEPCTALILERVISFDGSVSAEHGIGRLKKEWLLRQRGPVDVRVFRAIKSALDPDGLFQPGVLLPDA